jgi:hypothetical protein
MNDSAEKPVAMPPITKPLVRVRKRGLTADVTVTSLDGWKRRGWEVVAPQDTVKDG